MSSSSQPSAPVKARTDWNELTAIVTEGEVRDATQADAIDGVMPVKVIEPASEQELAKALAWTNENELCVAPRGSGTKLGWGSPPRVLDAVVSTQRLNRILEHAWADMTTTVEAGCTVAQLQDELAKHGQRLAIDPLFPERTTIGGLIATNDSGTLRLRYGGIRDLIIGITVALTDGTLARSGGKVVKNVAGYDLQKLMTGALGTLGIITQATFRLHPLPKESRTLSFDCQDADAANRLVLAIMDSMLVPTGLQLRMQADSTPRLDIRIDGIQAGVEAQSEQLQKLTADMRPAEGDADVWSQRESLWQGKEPAIICTVSVLPSQLVAVASAVARLCSSPQLGWKLMAQSTGLATLRIEASESSQLLFALNGIRAAVHGLGGNAVVLSCPTDMKRQIDAWGPTGDAQQLMVRVKQQFDPRGILNRGRFVGGI
jgi:glycolate dehydrogenase FAD-binding subunit